MLEIKNVTKTYRPKKGVPVKALDNVSLKFEDKGMVFILGKSGSGKSTLLNVLGGLDRADEGEFIIKGKSSKDFSQSDFDSYRNTFIGFIFQEYNILPEFTVGANIALAMELQGKKATTEALNEILDEVDLTGYGNRKPNELSGGQKQRVAIARALIKKPEMIMADEPTGALDSNTGKQVFDTLKKLSREKLVLVVSHDRDFAELYADRIIELKDGKIISDVSKTSVTPDVVNDGVSVVDDKIIHIKKGYKLTEKDLKLINDYISKADGDTLISVDGDKNEEIKKVVKINDQGGKDEFLDTKPENVKLKSYTKEDSKLIRSRLPYRNSFKIGASSLKAKPVRLVFTIFLCFVAFTLFGLADTMASYDKITTYERSITDSAIESAAFTKGKYYSYSGGGGYTDNRLLNDKDIAVINENSGVNVLPVYVDGQRYSSGGVNFSSSILKPGALENENGSEFYTSTASGFTEINQESFDKTGLTLAQGSRLPQAKNEIVITNYIYEHFKYAGLTYTDPSTGETVKIEAENLSTPQSVLGKYISFSDRYSGSTMTFTIVGVAETNFDSSKYEAYMPGAQRQDSSMLEMVTLQEMKTKLTYSYHSLCFVYPGVISDIIKSTATGRNQSPIGKDISESGNLALNGGSDNFYSFSAVAKLDQFTEKDAIVWTAGEKTTLAAGEIIVPFSFSYNYNTGENQGDRMLSAESVDYIMNTFGFGDRQEEIENATLYQVVYDLGVWAAEKYVNENGYPDSEDFRNMANAYWKYLNGGMEDYVLTDEDYKQVYKTFLQAKDFFTDENNVYYAGGFTVNKYGPAGYTLMRPYLKEIFALEGVTSQVNASGNVDLSSMYDHSNHISESYRVVGYYFPTAEAYSSVDQYGNPVVDYINTDALPLIVPDSYYNFFETEDAGYYSFAIGKMPYTDAAAVKKIVKFNYTAFDGDIYYELNNEVSFMLNNVNSLIEQLAKILLYVGIFFAVFASLMMYNFISVSISYKKREIGILRAVGARSSDVFGIFFNESLIITIINFILSSIATFVVAFVVNGVIRNQYGFTLTLLSVGIRQFALILGVGVLVAFIGSFLPVMRIARKRPIDAIQNR